VQVCADPLGHRLVRRVADEDVSEPERVVARKRGTVRSDQFAAHQTEQPRADIVLVVFG
jgi:hypothetical protein